MRHRLPGTLVQAAQLALAIALIVSAGIVSLSPLNSPYAPTTWGIVFLGAALALIAWRVRNHDSRITDLPPKN